MCAGPGLNVLGPFQMRYPRKTPCLAVLLAGAVQAAPAGVEPPTELSTVEEALELNPELPGREKGERQRPAPARAPEKAEPGAAPPAGGAAEEAAPREWFGHSPIWTWSRATGDWGGARTGLEDHGVTFAGSYTLDWQSLWSGGVSKSAATRSALDFNVTFDSLKLLKYEGGTLYADFYTTDMHERPDTGAIQSISSLETGVDVTELAELWYEQVLLGGVLRVKVGKVDANSEFAFTAPSGEFMNGSAAVDPNILGMPTWPDPATGVNLFVYPVERWYIGGGWYDGALGVDGIGTGRRGPSTFFTDEQSDDWFFIGETGLTWTALGSMARGRAGVGAWHHTGEWEEFDSGVEDGTTGLYLFGEQLVWDTTREDAEDDRGLWVFGQYAYADGSVSEIEHHIGAGLVLHGTFAGREDDAVGVYASWAGLTDDPDAGFDGNETALEVFYKIMVTPFFSVKPDLQYFINPGGDPEIDDALVGGLRLEVVF